MGASTNNMDLAARDDNSSGRVAGTPFTIGVLLAIVIGGSVVVCAAGAFLCIWLARKRARSRRDVDYVDAAEAFDQDDGTTSPRTQSPRRLQKRPSPEKRKSNRGSFLQSFSVPALSPMFGSDNRFVPIHSKSGESLTRLRSSSWIDEDAIHGPMMKKHGSKHRRKSSHRKSIRDSWPLRSLLSGTPTLPKVARIEEDLRDPYLRHDPFTSGAVSMPCLPVRQLPEPPKAAHLRQGEPVSMSGELPYAYEDFHQDQAERTSPTKNSSPTRSHARDPSADSTLSEILRSTEQRLQYGGTVRRHRSNISPARSTRGGQSESGDDSASWDMQSRTPSPAKTRQSAPALQTNHHNRQVSQTSALSEADSIYDAYGDSSPERSDVPTALTSPSRTHRNKRDHAGNRKVSPSSSVSSFLSTVYSEIETHGENSRFAPAPSRTPEEVGKIMMAHAAAQGDPFISHSPERPGKPLQMTTPIRNVSGLNRPPRFHTSSEKDVSSYPMGDKENSRPNSNDEDRSVNSTPTHARHTVHNHVSSERNGASDQARSQNVYPPPLRLTSSVSHKYKAKSFADHDTLYSRPGVLVTSPTSPGLGLGRVSVHKVTEVISPPPHLRPICSSPTLGREPAPPGEDDTLPPLPGSPELRLISQRKIAHNPASPTTKEKGSPQLGRMRGSVRIVSAASSIYSQFPEDTNAAVKSPVDKPAGPNWASLPITHANKDSLQVGSTIAELRRMNSAVSSYSAASSYYSATSNQDGDGVPLPILRGGGCSPSRRGGGTRRYLELGSNNNSPNTTPSKTAGAAAANAPPTTGDEQESAGDPEKDTSLIMPRIEVEMHSTPGNKRKRISGVTGSVRFQTPRKSPRHRLSDTMTQESIMEDSPGLYDRDGFLICSPPKS